MRRARHIFPTRPDLEIGIPARDLHVGYAASGEKVLRQRLEEVFAEEFAGYEVHKDLQAGVNGAKNYSYGLYLNGMPRAMIMECNNGVHHSIKSERLAEQASLSYGVPYMNFFAHLPNEKEYIANRLKENIR